MSKTARTLIKAALRSINAISVGATPSAEETADGLEALQFMLRSWSNNNILLYFIEQDTLTMSGASSYTIGSGGDANTVWPVDIKGAVVDSTYVLDIIDEQKYRKVSTSNNSGPPAYLYYNPEYPLGLLYVWPTGGNSMVLDTLKPLTDPTNLSSTVAFPTAYDDAIKWNLAERLAPEYGRVINPIIHKLAKESLDNLRTKNFANQLNATRLELISLDGVYDIDEG